jgi:transcriptional regulator with XRE-family HTH domain
VQKIDRADIATRFGELLRSARLAAGLSQEGLALEAGIDRTYVSMLERGIRVPTIVTLLQLAPHLGLSAFKLLKQLEESLSN